MCVNGISSYSVIKTLTPDLQLNTEGAPSVLTPHKFFQFNATFFSKSDVFLKTFILVAVLLTGLQKQQLSFYVLTVSIPDAKQKSG